MSATVPVQGKYRVRRERASASEPWAQCGPGTAAPSRRRGGGVTGVAVVTGAGSGIGAASAIALAREGWSVVLAGRRAEALDRVAASGPDGRMEPVPTDVTDETAVRALFDRAVDRFGRVDLLFNNAGTGGRAREPDELPLADWEAVVAVNLTRAFLFLGEACRGVRRPGPRGRA